MIKVFDVEVLVEGKSIGQGQGRSKKLAEQEAAKNAVEKGLDSCILKEIEIQGFKSFADKTKVVFDQGVTAVVGPNGSGKSNITESLRWALGESRCQESPWGQDAGCHLCRN